ncbi:MAG: CHASE3 domain-containing protein [Pyrinomonadaceae bacterium]
MKLTLEKQIPLAFLVALIVLMTISFFAYRQINSLGEAMRWEKHTQEVLSQLDSTFALMLDAEAGARGYLISGDESFLEPYNRANRSIGENLRGLRNLTIDNKEQAQKIPNLENLINQRLDLLRQAIAARRAQGLTQTNSRISLEGKALMDEVRTQITQMKDTEKSLLVKREADLDNSVSGTYRMLFLGSIAGILSLGLANLAIFRETGKLSKAENALKDANRELETRVKTRTAELGKTNDELKNEAARRERSEEAMRQGEAFTRTILDSLSAHIAVVNQSGEIIAVNNAWEDFARQNCAGEKISVTGVGQNYLEVCRRAAEFDDEAKYILENLEAILSGKKTTFTFEYPCHSPDAETWFILQVNALQNSGGAVISHINITERKAAEKATAHLAAIVESSDDAIISKDLNGIITSWNKGAESLFGYAAAEAVGQLITILIPPHRINEESQIIERIQHGEKVIFYETVRQRKDKSQVEVSLTVSPVLDKDGKVIGASKIARNIADQKQAEAEREKLLAGEQTARQDAEIANRLRDEFLATVSHELRAPLKSILGWARLMQQGKVDEKTTRKAVETIVRNADAQNRLIEDLLDVSRIISGKLRLEVMTVKPSSFVESAMETVRPAAEAKNIRLEIYEDAEISHISGDPNRLQQVIWNLLSNAIKFTPNDGKVSVEIARADSHVEVRVKDSGVGIKADFLPHVFDRFSQADASSIRKFGGLGLGLAIVRHLTEMHGGTVHAHSAGEGKGATFVVRLPIIASPTETETVSEIHKPFLEAETNLSLDGLLILVVDDEEDTRQLLVQTLTHYGATVIAAESAEAGLKAVKNQKPDVLVSDIGMPDEDGYSLIKKTRALGIEIPAVALTAFTRARDRMRSLSSGCQNHVAKPVQPNELVTVIASLTGRLQISDGE